MINRVLILLGLFSVIFTGCSKSITVTADTIEDAKYTAEINRCNDYLKYLNFTGTVLVAKKGKILYAKGFGVCDKNDENSLPVTIQSTFETGSISKQFCSSLIMQFVEKGKLSVDDKISKFFPDYKYGNEITVHDLLTMKSGIPVNMGLSADELKQFNSFVEKNEELEKDTLLNAIYETPLHFTPGTKFEYVNWNYYLLAKIVEQLSGMDYHEYLTKKILIPCNMVSTNMKTGQVDVIGYTYKNEALHPSRELSLGSGDLNSNVIDLFNWTQNFSSGKIVNLKSIQKMVKTDGFYGYGLMLKQNTIYHTGSTYCYNSIMEYDVKTKATYIVLTNVTTNTRSAESISSALKAFWKSAID